MRKSADAQTLSAEVLKDCGNIKRDSLVCILICIEKWKFLGYYILFEENTPLKQQRIVGYNLVTFLKKFTL